MWKSDKKLPARGFSTPPASWKSRPFRSPKIPFSERKKSSANSVTRTDLFHIIHKVPAGDSPYVKAKQVQLIDKDPGRAIALFWSAINAGDRVDSALKDMAIVMKQMDRADEAIEAIKSFRHLCPYDSQESIDNVLVELYKRCGRIDEEIEMLQCKLRQIEEGSIFGGKRTKTARSQGKKVHITVEQETSRVLGNLAWAYLQQNNVRVAESYYRKALSLEPDNNKKCNLAICLIQMNRLSEANSLLQSVKASSGCRPMEESYVKSFERAVQLLAEKESQMSYNSTEQDEDSSVVSNVKGRLSEGKWSNVRDDRHCVFEHSESTRPTREDEELLNEVNRECYHRNHYEKKDKHQNAHGTNCCKRSNFRISCKSPNPARRNLNVDADADIEVPFTQPKNCLWKSSSGQRPRQNRSIRKVLFEKPVTNGNSRSMQDQNFDDDDDDFTSNASEETGATVNYKTKDLSTANVIELEVPFTQPRSCPWSSIGALLLESKDISYGFNGKLSFEQSASTENIQSLAGEGDGSVETNVEEERLDLYRSNDQKLDPKPFTTKTREKKSWADMVEEEEEEADGEDEFSSGKEDSDCLGGNWSTDESNEEVEFNDENQNSNILLHRRHRNQSPSMNQFEESQIKEGNRGDSDEYVLLRSSSVRRPLYYESAVNYRSPLPMKDLNSEMSSSEQEKIRQSSYSIARENLTRRGRLQIFQDIISSR